MAAVMAWLRTAVVDLSKAPASGAGPGIRSHRADYHMYDMPLHPRRGKSSDGVSGDPRARDGIPTRRSVKMSGGVLPISTTGGTTSPTTPRPAAGRQPGLGPGP